jgi:clan AA aspartic protease (TIGR02281 family)
VRGAHLLVLLSLLVVVPACDDGPTPPATTGEFGQRTPAYMSGLIPVVDVTAADQTGLQFIVDTGSPVTLLNSASFGHGEDYSASGTTDLQAFNLGFTAVPTVTYAAFGADACGDLTLAGIVGGDLLQFYALTVDYLGAALFLWDGLGGSPDIGQDVAPATTVKVHLEGGGRANVVGIVVNLPPTRLVVDGTLEETDAAFLVDTGASMVTLPQSVFDTLGSQDRPRIADVPVQTVYGESTGFIVRLRSLSVGEVTQTDVPAFVTPDATLFNDISREVGITIRALVGGTFLRQYQTTIRYGAHRLDFASYNNPVHVNPREFIGPGFDLGEGCDGGIYVVRVFAGTSAADQGIQPGYQLTAVDTQPVAGLTIDEVDRLMRSYDAGAEVTMDLRPGMAARSYTFVYSDLLPRFAQ